MAADLSHVPELSDLVSFSGVVMTHWLVVFWYCVPGVLMVAWWDACMRWIGVCEYLQQVFLCQQAVGVMAGCQDCCLRFLWCSGLYHTSACGVTELSGNDLLRH